jgi:Costars
MDVEHEVKLLVEEITRLGAKRPDGKVSVKFGTWRERVSSLRDAFAKCARSWREGECTGRVREKRARIGVHGMAVPR